MLFGVAAVVVLLVGAFVALVTLPAFQVQETSVRGTTYVDAEAVDAAVASATGSSVLLLPVDDLEASAEEVPGVAGATVTRDWPHGMTVTIAERTPLATITDASGITSVVDADGVVLPEAAAVDRHLVPLAIGAGSTDHGAASSAMLDVLASLPEDLRAQTTAVTASTGSDVTLTIDTGEGGTKTVVWGSPEDPDLKAKVTAALLTRPGSVVDVSSPVAPVTRA